MLSARILSSQYDIDCEIPMLYQPDYMFHSIFG